MSDRTLLCIGWARAGSTAFRQNFLARHPDIVCVGRGQRDSDGPGGLILDILKTAGDAEFDACVDGLRDAWEAYARAQGARVVCLSDEELSIGLRGGAPPVAIAARCRRLFPGARVLAVVRHQAEAVRSFHALSQREGLGEPMAYPDWVRRFFLDPSREAGFAYLFDYAAVLAAYRTDGGRVMVLRHDRLSRDHAAVYAQAAQWLGISESVAAALPNAVVNASAPRDHADDGARALLDARLRALYAEDNRALARDFGVRFGRAAAGERE